MIVLRCVLVVTGLVACGAFLLLAEPLGLLRGFGALVAAMAAEFLFMAAVEA